MPERYQQEIEDLLGKVNTPNSIQSELHKRGLLSIIKTARSYLAGKSSQTLSIGRIIIGILTIMLIATLFNARMPGLWIPIASTAIIILICCYVFPLIRINYTYERRWRGRVIDIQPSLRETITNWLKRRLSRY